jgi:hypothetical protein
MSASKFGDIQVGRYNCLPRDSGKVPYTAPTSIFLSRLPSFQNVVQWYPTMGVVTPTWDHHVTESQIKAEMKLEDAYTQLTEKTKGHWHGHDFDKSNVTVIHQSWSQWPKGCQEDNALKTLYGQDAPLAALCQLCGMKNGRPAAFVGNLVGVAPFVCATVPVEGEVTKEYVDEESVSVTNSTTEGWEFGLSAEAGINVKGAEVKRTASFKWSKVTTQTTVVTKTHSDSTKLPVKTGEWGRLDVRVCAGLYSGWLAYKTNENNNAIGLYPMRAPIHVPDFASPVAVHRMSAPSSRFSPAERALVQAYTQNAAELDALSQGAGQRSVEDYAQLTQRQLEALRLESALSMLGL